MRRPTSDTCPTLLWNWDNPSHKIKECGKPANKYALMVRGRILGAASACSEHDMVYRNQPDWWPLEDVLLPEDT